MPRVPYNKDGTFCNTCSEIEKFITDNTKEISKEKFLCPLSGKKFRGPEFVRKHIFNKHASKLEEVKQDVRWIFTFTVTELIYPLG